MNMNLPLGSSSPLCLSILKEGSGVRRKHNCLGFVFIAAIVTTCFGRAWPSSGHNVEVMHKREKTQLYVYRRYIRGNEISSVYIHLCFFSFVHDFKIVT
jgi:hypothetical protein